MRRRSAPRLRFAPLLALAHDQSFHLMRRRNFDKEWKSDEATLKIVKRDRSDYLCCNRRQVVQATGNEPIKPSMIRSAVQ